MTANDVERLAALVVEKILEDESLWRTIGNRPKPGPADCPPHTLCCSKNHVCEGHGGFACSPPYRCSAGFEDKVAAF
jgi:hypothetical protein